MIKIISIGILLILSFTGCSKVSKKSTSLVDVPQLGDSFPREFKKYQCLYANVAKDLFVRCDDVLYEDYRLLCSHVGQKRNGRGVIVGYTEWRQVKHMPKTDNVFIPQGRNMEFFRYGDSFLNHWSKVTAYFVPEGTESERTSNCKGKLWLHASSCDR